MTLHSILTGLVLAAVSGSQPSGWVQREPAPPDCAYPSELPSFQICAKAPWRVLRPLVSTAADVRRVLGTPTDQGDMAHYGEPYPGDARAEAPVLAFDGGPHWQVIVYFVKSDARARD